jgi:hypothetical protein
MQQVGSLPSEFVGMLERTFNSLATSFLGLHEGSLE